MQTRAFRQTVRPSSRHTSRCAAGRHQPSTIELRELKVGSGGGGRGGGEGAFQVFADLESVRIYFRRVSRSRRRRQTWWDTLADRFRVTEQSYTDSFRTVNLSDSRNDARSLARSRRTTRSIRSNDEDRKVRDCGSIAPHIGNYVVEHETSGISRRGRLLTYWPPVVNVIRARRGELCDSDSGSYGRYAFFEINPWR